MTRRRIDEEEHRQREQDRLDGLKTSSERNQLGQFSTPSALALDIARYVRRLWRSREDLVRFLDPAIGTGSFYSALLKVFGEEAISRAQGIELDESFVDSAKLLWARRGLEVQSGDFTKLRPPEETGRPNLILTNPPYVRHHHISGPDKDRLKVRVAEELGIEISGLAGLYCYFLLLADRWLADNGIGVWLIPSEFMEVNYGAALLKYLTDRVQLIRIHRFCPTDVQFGDALVTSAIVVFRKATPPQGHSARFSFGGSIRKPDQIARVPLQRLRSSGKWTRFPAQPGSGEEPTKSGPRLRDIFGTKRGIATGSNAFFVMPREQAREIGIPPLALRPILPSPRHLRQDVVETDPEGWPLIDPQLALIDSDLPEEEIRDRYPSFWSYLETGIEKGLHERYLARHRKPWYSQEQRPIAPFLCTYMGRSGNGANPFRFIWNKSNATAANAYLLLFPKGRLLEAIEDDPKLLRSVHEVLTGMDPTAFVQGGRVYGGGLHKIEPKELGSVSAEVFEQIVPGVFRTPQLHFPFAGNSHPGSLP